MFHVYTNIAFGTHLKSIGDLKSMFHNPEGRKMIRDSMALKPISKEKRKEQFERLRKSFALQEDDVRTT
jgi:hypothetical protein